MELQEAILKRRSIRKFSDYHVTDNEINDMLEAARWAPSWANTQSWEFIIVRDRRLIEDVTATYSERNPATNCSKSASVLVVACAKKGLSGYKEGVQRTKYSDWFMFDLGMAVQNLLLKAHELGLGSVVVGLLDHDSCKKLLVMPNDFEVVVVIPIGKPAIEGKEGPPRKELKSFAHLNSFGENLIK